MISIREIVWTESGGLCFFCRAPIPFLNRTFDHLVPKSKGGMDTAQNLVVACRTCNENKGSTFPTFDQLERAARRRFTLNRPKKVRVMSSPEGHRVIDTCNRILIEKPTRAEAINWAGYQGYELV